MNEITITNAAGGQHSDVALALYLVDPNFFRYMFFDEEVESLQIKAMHQIYDYISSGTITYLYDALKLLTPDKSDMLFTIGKVLKEGEGKYAPNNWRKVPREIHLNHALNHLYNDYNGDKTQNHIEHTICRLMMSIATGESEGFRCQKQYNSSIFLDALWSEGFKSA